MNKVVHLEEHRNFNGERIPITQKPDIIKVEKIHLSDSSNEIASTYEPNEKEESNMDQSIKGYIDEKISSIEKSIDQRLTYQEKLISEKIDHLHTKTEKTIKESINDFKESFNRDRKGDRKFYVSTAIAIATIVVALLGYIL